MFAHISYTIFLQNTNFRTSDFKKFAQSLPIKIRHTKRKTFPQCSFDADPKFALCYAIKNWHMHSGQLIFFCS